MADNRPTFSESWYRVADLTPRLPAAVKVRIQYFRGKKWAVLQDPVNNDYFRLSDTAYYFSAMLDGRHTVAQVWQHCMDQFGDDAPTQDEVIRVLGQLYQANLLQTTIPPDAQSLFRHHRQRKRREVQGVLLNLLFVRIPLWDPDLFLDLWGRAFGRLFSWTGLVLWLITIAAGVWAVLGRLDDLTTQASVLFNPKNIPLLYLSLVLLKICHEMGHALACKHFGRMEGTGGEVHKMGITFLIFTPLPFVDASSAWAFKSKRRRMVVSASGVIVEFTVAALAALVWARTAEGTTTHAIACNLMFIASISTLLFNGNPFLRYDAYYLLSDFLEIPNLDARAKLYGAYLIKRYLWGMDKIHDPSHGEGERKWLGFYCVASILVRLAVMGVIAVTIGSRLAVVGMLITAALVFTWVILPGGKLIRYLATSRELMRVRPRAVATSVLASACLLTAVGLVNLPDRCRVEGVVEPVRFAEIYTRADGVIRAIQKSGTWIDSDGPWLIQAENKVVEMERHRLLADMRQLKIRRQIAQTRGAAEVQVLEEKILAVSEQIERNRQELAALHLTSPVSGTWISPDADRLTGRFLERGQRIGMVASLDALRIRAVAGQKEAARLILEAVPLVEIRVKGRQDMTWTGLLGTILPAGHEQLPSAALGYSVGGATQTDAKDPSGRRAAEPFFEILVDPQPGEKTGLRPGQRVVLRFETRPKPLLVQGWRELLQLFQSRFKV